MKIKDLMVHNLNFKCMILNFDDGFSEFDENMIGLSKSELECAKLLMKGNSNTEIAKKLSILNNTVSYYKKRILQKTKT